MVGAVCFVKYFRAIKARYNVSKIKEFEITPNLITVDDMVAQWIL